MAGPFDDADKNALDALEREIQGDSTDADELPSEVELGAPVDEKDAEERQTRDEKKRARRPLMAELDAVREEARQAREEAARLREENRRALEQFEQRARGQQQVDPARAELDAIYADEERFVSDYNRRTAEYQQANQRMPDNEAAEWRKRAREIEEKKARTIARQASAVDPSQYTQQQLKSEYPDVFAHPQAFLRAQGEIAILKSRGENSDDIRVMRRALDTARDEFGLGGKRKVDPSDAPRYRSAPRGGNGAGGKEPARIAWNKDLQRLADSMYSQEPDPKKRAQMWVNENGKDYLAATSQRR